MTVRTVCPYCGVGCGLLVTSDGTVSGDPQHPANFGRLCSKGAALGETLAAEGRLLEPLIGGRRASWDEALDLVAARFTQAIARGGPDTVAFYVSGQLLTEDYYVANKFSKGFIGTANIDSNSRLCMASSVAGHIRPLGRTSYQAASRISMKLTLRSSSAATPPGAIRFSISASLQPKRSAGRGS
jgi:assimilatory nitrate reductase catalytic subunit